MNYAHLGLGCDTPILEALYHGVGETVLERDQVLLETCYQHLLVRGYSITGVQWPNSADDRLSALFDLGNHQLWLGYARVDERQILQLQDSDQEYIRFLLPRDGTTLAFLHPIVCRKLQAMTKQE